LPANRSANCWLRKSKRSEFPVPLEHPFHWSGFFYVATKAAAPKVICLDADKAELFRRSLAKQIFFRRGTSPVDWASERLSSTFDFIGKGYIGSHPLF
jgi:hypothetical protein